MNSDIMNAGKPAVVDFSVTWDVTSADSFSMNAAGWLPSIEPLKNCAAETKSRPVTMNLRIAPVSAKKRAAGSAENRCV